MEELEKRQAINALHADTKHYHLHLAVNRVDPDTEKAMLPNRSFDLQLSAEHGFRINNPELQQQIQQERQQLPEQKRVVKNSDAKRKRLERQRARNGPER